MRKLLLCPPDYYGIEYEINPWMDRACNAVPDLARAQWQRLYESLKLLGCEIELISPRKNLPDMVFTANAGLVAGTTFIRSNFRFPERQGEERWFEKWFTERGFEVISLPPDLFFEGEGDALFSQQILFCGYRFRSDIRSHRFIGERLNCLVISVELVQERYYHLDTCFCPLPDGALIWFPDAFDTYGQQAIRHHVSDRIEVVSEEAKQFACNAIVLGKDIILPGNCPRLCRELHERGYRTIELPMTEFLKAGGACKCLTLFVPQVAHKPGGKLAVEEIAPADH
jgi:N-dimethylarginine dimethylaminohydrolase